MRITILTDNEESWFIEYGNKLLEILVSKGHDVEYVFNKSNIRRGDISFLLSCSNIVNTEYLKLNNYNIVVHASDLPQGKGFSPLQWQILNGQNEITLTLFEAVKEVDAGPYYLKDKIKFIGTELYQELRESLGNKIIEMCSNFVDNFNELKPIDQKGVSTYFSRRTIRDDIIDVDKTIREQFNHFRIADNEKFPLWFEYLGNKYYIKIYKSPN